MNPADPFKQLVERKLWPVALLLVAALVAVPFLMAKEPEPVSLPSPTTSAPAAEDSTASVVSLGDPAARDEVRAVVGARKDPFRPAQFHRVEKETDDTLTDAGAATTVDSSSGTTTSSGGGTSTSSGTTTSSEGTSAPAPVVDTVAIDVPAVLFSLKESGGEVTPKVPKRLQGFPSAANPVALYLGLDEKSRAVFSLDDAATVSEDSDGRCEPAQDDCDILVVDNDETVFLARGEKEYKLEVLIESFDVRPEAAAKYWAKVAEGGADALKEFGAAGYRYDKATGRVEQIERKQRKAGAAAGFSSAG